MIENWSDMIENFKSRIHGKGSTFQFDNIGHIIIIHVIAS